MLRQVAAVVGVFMAGSWALDIFNQRTSDVDFKEKKQIYDCLGAIDPEITTTDRFSELFSDYKSAVYISGEQEYLISFYKKPNEVIEQRQQTLSPNKIPENNKMVRTVNHCVQTIQPSFHVAVYDLVKLNAIFFISPDVQKLKI